MALQFGRFHVGFGAEAKLGGSAIGVEHELHPLAGPEHPKQGPVEGVLGEIDIGEVSFVDQDTVAGAGVVALDDALHI